MGTAALECLHRQHPGRFLTDVSGTAADDLFQHNPHVTPLGDDCRVIRMEYPLIHQSGSRPVHFLQGYVEFLARELGVPLECCVNRPYLYLTPQEKSWVNQVRTTFGHEGPYWLICSGIKKDFTVKAWGTERWQAVVDALPNLKFVQVGEKHHSHPLLEGVLDLRGQTDTRQLLRLAYHSSGGLGGVSFLHHVYAALEKPFVCVASGMEPRSWEAYGTEVYITRQGQLPCCRLGGCWKAKADPAANSCVLPVRCGDEWVGKCMDLIGVDEVVNGVLSYYRGGLIE